MDNVKHCIDHILENYKDILIEELDIETVVGQEEWEMHHEMISAILTIIRNDKVFEDPVLFAQVVLAINGIQTSFLEWEFITPEMAALFFKTCEYLESKIHDFKSTELDDDVSTYICVCCAEDGLFFLKDYLAQFQYILNEVLHTVYNVNITEDDIKDCEHIYKTYKDMPTEAVPEDTAELIQAKKNYIIRDYLKEIF